MNNDAYQIKGGKKIKGEINLSGAKNAALKLIIASLLFEHKVILENVPQIKDIETLLKLINNLGVKVKFVDKNIIEIDPLTLNHNQVDLFYGSKVRVSFMLFAPLLYHFGECYIPNPGGCRIGTRPIDRIVCGMESLGIKVEYSSQTGYYHAQMSKKPSGYYSFSKPSHTGTELLIMLSVFSNNEVVIDNASQEPEIDNLIDFLNQAGAKIRREEKKIIIQGVKKLSLKKPFKTIYDRNEAVTYATLALASKGEVTINHIHPSLISYFLEKVKKTGNVYEILKDNKIKFIGQNNFQAVDVETGPHPGFMTDWQPNWAVLMTQANGISVIHERVFENRFAFVTQLKKLGARIEFFQPKIDQPQDFYYFNYLPQNRYYQAIKIYGPKKLHGGVLDIYDLRAGASLVIAGLIAQGETIINGASILERGYEDIVKKIKILGGQIKKITL